MKKTWKSIIAFTKKHAKSAMLFVAVAILGGIVAGTFVSCGKNAHEHIYVTEKVEATCANGGYTLFTCECGDFYKTNETPALEHEYGEWDIVLPATPEHEGEKVHRCRNCNHHVTEVIPKAEPHEHTYEESIVSATCSAGGYTKQTCKECGYVTTTNETPALGHSWSGWNVTKKATTTAAGSKTRTCRSCGKSVTEATPKLSAETHTHTYTSKVVEATCTTGGYTRHTCSCGKTYDSDQTEPLSHLYSDWKTTIQPTTAQEGEKECSCTRCGHTLTEAVPKLPAQTTENQSGYVDSRVSIRRRGDGATNYGYGSVNVTDTRSWGGRPSVSITSAGGLSVSYYKQDGSKVYCTADPEEGYVKWVIILDDGSYTVSLIGDFND